MDKWISYQRKMAQSWRTEFVSDRRYSYHQSDLEQAYRLYTLALAGAPEMGAMNRLKELPSLTLQAKWRLTAAYALCGKKEAANELVFNATSEVASYSSNNPTFGSSFRDESMILETMALLDYKEKAFEQAKRVSKQLSREQSFSTQSTAYALMAMGQFAQRMSGSLDFGWSLNEKKQSDVKSKKAIYQATIPTNPLRGKISIRNGNEGVLYVSVASKTRPIIDELEATQSNLSLSVRYVDMEGNAIGVERLSQGTDFYALIRISNLSGTENYTDLALTQIIPSGWEIYNERMVNASSTNDEAEESMSKSYTYQDIRDDRVLTYFDLPMGKSKEFRVRLQATYMGDFVFPAIQCEAMYDPSASARTSASRVVVEK